MSSDCVDARRSAFIIGGLPIRSFCALITVRLRLSGRRCPAYRRASSAEQVSNDVPAGDLTDAASGIVFLAIPQNATFLARTGVQLT
jgi:hypothetical protein